MKARLGFVVFLATWATACAPRIGPPPEPPEQEFALPTPSAGPAAYVLLISVAGLDVRAYAAVETMPTLAALARTGAVAEGVVPVAPASPQPAHASLVTGRMPASHGIGGDHPLGTQGAEAVLHRNADRLEAPALWTVTREHGLLSGAIGWPTSAGAPVDWSFPELFPARVGEASPAMLEGLATPALLESATAKGAEAPPFGFPGAPRDHLLTELSCEVLNGDAAPRLLLLRLSQTEPVLRRFGRDSSEARTAFESVDAELRRLAICLRDAGRLAQSAWFVTGDAPVQAVHTRIQANRPLERAGLLVPAPGSRTGIGRWDAVVRTNGGSAFVYARDTEAAVLARRALSEVADSSGAFRIVSAQEMIRLGADRRAWFGLEAMPGFAFTDDLRGRTLVGPSSSRSAAGHLSASESSPHRLGFVAWGSGIRAGIRIPEMHQVDVAPTVARALGLSLPGADGNPRPGLFGTPPVASDRSPESTVGR